MHKKVSRHIYLCALDFPFIHVSPTHTLLGLSRTTRIKRKPGKFLILLHLNTIKVVTGINIYTFYIFLVLELMLKWAEQCWVQKRLIYSNVHKSIYFFYYHKSCMNIVLFKRSFLFLVVLFYFAGSFYMYGNTHWISIHLKLKVYKWTIPKAKQIY